jgi:tryptophan synthase alpha chain
MTHLVANYPDPEDFEKALEAMLDFEVQYLEIQLPFSNPLADGPLIFEANKTALKYDQALEEILANISKIYNLKQRSTKLLLMSYFTPILNLGLENVVKICKENGFSGFIIPDLIFGSGEQKTMTGICEQNQMQLIPVISPLTKLERLEQIKNDLEPKQIVYAMARSGRTGKETSLEYIQSYLDFLKQNLTDFEIAVGFGIKEKAQVQFLNEQDFISVIGSQIIREIQQSQQNSNSTYTQLSIYLSEL